MDKPKGKERPMAAATVPAISATVRFFLWRSPPLRIGLKTGTLLTRAFLQCSLRAVDESLFFPNKSLTVLLGLRSARASSATVHRAFLFFFCQSRM